MQLLQDAGARARGAMSGFTPGQIGVIAVGVIGLVLAGFVFLRMSAPPMAPLYSNLAAEDAAAVVQQLDTNGVAYELQDGGGTILVAQDQVYATRLAMSAEGLPTNSTDGYSLLDQQGITTSEFMQNVTYQRALEGELAQTIMAIDGVETATVHLAMPEKSVFTQDSDKPTASVMVQLANGTVLDPGQVQAITNLVASSVPKLTAASVTVADSTGALLTSGTGTGGMAASTQAQAQVRLEQQLAQAAQSMLDNVVGAGNAAVRVNASLDFDQRETTTQTYQYEAGVPPISSSSSTEKYNGTGSVPGGVVGNGTTTAQTPAGGTAATNTYEKSSSTQNNAVGSTTESRTGAPGSIKRLTVAVLLNAEGGAVDPAVISSLVSNAVGLDVTRGDSIQVTPMAFDTTAADAAAEAAAAAADAESRTMLFDLVKKAGIALLVIVVIALAFLSSRKQRRSLLDAEELAAIGFAPQPLAITRGADAASLEAVVLPAVEEPRAIDQNKADIQELVAKQPDEVAQLLRGWIASGR